MFGFERRDVRLIVSFAKNNIRDKYLGTTLGGFWGVAQPLLMLAVYTFVFGFVFKARLPGADTTFAYAIWLISGYGPWMSIAEGTIACSTSITSSAGIVKNMAFKTEVLPIAAVLAGILPLLVSLCFLVILLVVDGNMPTWHMFFLPLVVASQFLFVASIGIPLSAVTVFFRDLTYVLPNVLMIVLFMSPIFYPPESMPRPLQGVSSYNPFYILAEAYRAVLLYHRVPDLIGLGCVSSFAIVFGSLMLLYFRRLKGYFEAAL